MSSDGRVHGPDADALACGPERPCRPDSLTIVAFAVLVLLIAANPLAVRFTDRELAPFWGGGTRLATASLIFFAFVAIRRVPLPRGRDLLGVIFFGILQFGLGFGLGYWALVKVPAGIAGVILAAIPLFTLVFAVLARIEAPTLRGALGAIISLAGIAVIVGAHTGPRVPLLYLAASVGFAACLAGGLVVAKSLNRVHPAAMNAIGMLVGSALLLAVAFIIQEPTPLPRANATWAVQLYVITAGSVGTFALLLFVVRRWTATGASYQTVLSPPVTILLASWLLKEPISGGLVWGTAIVLAGVYVGALSHPPRPVMPVPKDADAS